MEGSGREWEEHVATDRELSVGAFGRTAAEDSASSSTVGYCKSHLSGRELSDCGQEDRWGGDKEKITGWFGSDSSDFKTRIRINWLRVG